MADLLSKEAYRELVGKLEFRTQAFIDGQFCSAKSGRTFTTTNPATGDVLAEISACDAQDVDAAVAAAKAAFDDARWQGLSPAARKSVLLRFAQLLEDNSHELAVLESLDSGKPIRECQNVDVPETIHTLRWHAELIDKIYDVTMVVREPIGVVGLVLPWNFPLLMLAWKIGPS